MTSTDSGNNPAPSFTAYCPWCLRLFDTGGKCPNECFDAEDVRVVPDSIVDAITKERDALKVHIKELEARLADAEGFRASHETCCLELIYRQERDQARRDLDRMDHEYASLKASIQELEAERTRLLAQLDIYIAGHGEMVSRLNKIKALHYEDGEPTTDDYGVQHWCACGEYYPCPTRRAAEGKP